VTHGLRKVESSTLQQREEFKECGDEKARGLLHPKCESGRRKVSTLLSLRLFFDSNEENTIIFFFNIFVSYLPPPPPTYLPLFTFFVLLLQQRRK